MDIKIKNYKIKTSIVSPEWPKARANLSVINFMIFILIFIENCLKFDAIHDFSVWLRTGSNQTDSNRFRSFEYQHNLQSKIFLFLIAGSACFIFLFYPQKFVLNKNATFAEFNRSKFV